MQPPVTGAAPLFVAPNPAAEQVRITGLDGTATDLSVSDLSGRRVRWQQLPRQATQVELDVRTLESGTYQLLLTSPTATRSAKVVVVH